MLFNSLEFLIFFPIVCLLYFPLPQVLKKPWLLVCSYYFYMCWDARFALLILVSTLSTWACGFLIEKADTPRVRKLALAVNLALNLGILFLFKYFDFFSGSIADFFALLGLEYKAPLLGLTLPVGISFYTFQALGYSIDVYRGDIPHEKSLLNYMLFVSFFPQLVAGPIERSTNFLPQLHQRTYFDERRTEEGVIRMLVGFFKKVVIADGAAVFVDLVYASPQSFDGAALIIATLLFAVQIYCDFAGYSDIAVGAAQVLGYRLMQNFDRPYFATSIRDFWRRWHISLSFWLRDYLYIPLGGSRKGQLRKALNLVITFLASGLWHGASWNFVIWGGLNGIYQAVDSLTLPLREKLTRIFRLDKLKLITGAIGMAVTFCLVCFSWIFFRAQTLEQAGTVISRIFADADTLLQGETWLAALQSMDFFGGLAHDSIGLGNLVTGTGTGLAVCILLLTLLDICEGRDGALAARVNRCVYPVRWLFCILLLGAILLYGSFEPSGFYYFQF